MHYLERARKSGRNVKLLIGCGAVLALCAVCLFITALFSPAAQTQSQRLSATMTAPARPALPTRAPTVPSTQLRTLSPTQTAPPVRSSPVPATETPPLATPKNTTASNACPNGCAVSTPPAGCTIKGNVNSDHEKIYHLPGNRDYARTQIVPAEGDRWFCSEADALAAGFRHALR